jgi:hypothetical protein
MCIERFKRIKISEIVGDSDVSLENALLILEASAAMQEEVTLKPNICTCNHCPKFKSLYLSLTGVAHVDTTGDIFIGNTTLLDCSSIVTDYRWLPLVCHNTVYSGLGSTEEELCFPLNSYSELFSKAMNVNWNEFSECLRGPLLGFKKCYSFDRTGELLYVYNKTCRTFGLPKFHRTIRCKWKKKQALDKIAEDLISQVEDLNDAEIMRLMVEVSSYDDEMKGFVTLEGLPVVEPIEVFVNPTVEEGKLAKAVYKEKLKEIKKCLVSERKHRKEVNFDEEPECNEPIKHLLSFVKDQIKKPDGETWDLRQYGRISLHRTKMTHVGDPDFVPGKILKSGKEGRPRAVFNNKKTCEKVASIMSAASAFRAGQPRSQEVLDMMAEQSKRRAKDQPMHDFAKMKVHVYKNKKCPLLNDAALKKQIVTKKSSYEKIILPGKVFPMSKFYKFLRIKVHELLVRHEYSSYLTIGSGFDIKQTKPLRTSSFFSDTICQEIFWVDFSKKYGKPDQYQELLKEFDMYLGADYGDLDIEKSCRIFFNKMLKNIINRNKRIKLSSLKEEQKAVMGYLLLTCDNDIFNYRKELKITSGCLKSLIRSRARLKI